MNYLPGIMNFKRRACIQLNNSISVTWHNEINLTWPKCEITESAIVYLLNTYGDQYFLNETNP